jgi:hypothetical protein
MKTGEVQDTGDGAEPHLEVDGWTPWLYHAPEDELERYYSTANALMMKLERMPPAVRARLKQIEIRCPVKGCLLATVYWIPRRPTTEDLEHHRRFMNTVQALGGPKTLAPEVGTYFYVGRTAAGTEVYDIPFYGFSRTPRDKARGCTCCRMVYWRAGCCHGTASLERNAMLDKFSLADRRHRPWETEEEAFAKLPEQLRPFWGKRVFHPEPSAWHPKKRQRTSNRQDPSPPRISDPLGGR